MAWDFLSFTQGVQSGQSEGIAANGRAQRAENAVVHAGNLGIVLAHEIGNLRGQVRYFRSVAAGQSALKDALKTALLEVAPHHPLMDGDSGEQLRRSICDKAYNDEYMNGYRDEAPAEPEPQPTAAPAPPVRGFKNFFGLGAKEASVEAPPAPEPTPEPAPSLSNYSDKGLKGSTLSRR